MHWILVIAASLASLSVFVSPSVAQDRGECTNCISEADARADLDELFQRLPQEHVDLYARTQKPAYDALVERLKSEIDGPLTPAQFHAVVQDAMAFGRIGHAKTEAPIGDVIAHVQAGGTIIPLSVVYRGDAMLTDNWSGPGQALPPGSRITHIDGLTVAQFEVLLRQVISADTDLLLRSQAENAMPAYLFLVFGPREALDVKYIAPDGTAGTHSVAAMGFGEMYAMQAERGLPSPGRNPSERIFRDLGNGIFYLQPGPFSASEEERGESGGDYAIGPFKAFVEDAFAALSASGARKLVIDLRDNPGGDVSFSDLIIARLTDQPYRFASRYEIRAGENTKASWADWQGDPNSLGGRVAAAIRAADVGERVPVDLPLTQPIADNAFDGSVYLLVNKHSYSNAAVVAALVQDLGIATIMGEETADLATTYGAVEQFSLSRSGTPITYPKAYMVRPSGSEAVRGVVPDFLIAPNAIGASSDTMLETAVTQILLEE